MPVRRMLALLAAVLSFGGFIAGISGYGVPVGFGVVLSALLWVVAVAIAGVLLLPVALVQRGRPSRQAVAVALVIAGLLVYPVRGSFYQDPHWAEQDSQVGRCWGILLLPEAVQNHVTDDTYARFAMPAGCND